MKKSMKFLVGGLAGVVVLGAVYFGAGGGLQGKIALNEPITKAELVKLFSVVVADKDGTDLSRFKCTPFSDVKADHWAASYVCYMYELGVMKGYADGTFGPSKYVSRAEAAKVVVMLMGLSVGDLGKGAPYADVPPNHWFAEWDNAFAEYGVGDVKGWKGAKFYPDTNLTKGRAQYWADNLKKALNK